MLRIRVSDSRHAAALLAHVRSCGCIAFVSAEGVVDALLPDVSWREEEPRIRSFVGSWQSARPGIELSIEPIDA